MAATARQAIRRWSAATISPPARQDLPAASTIISHATAWLGFALAGGGTNWSLAQGLGGGRSDAFQAGVYGATRSGPAYVAAAFAYTNHWMSTDRFAFAGDHLTASFKAQSFGARVEGGYRFATMFGGLTPYAAVQAQNFRTPSYSETDVNGGGFALAYHGRTGTDTRSELGARFDRLLAINPNAVLTLRARLAWAHDWVSDPDARGGVPDAAGRELHRQRRDAGEGFRAGVGRHRASPRQRRLAARQIRRRVRLAAPPPMPAQGRCATRGEQQRDCLGHSRTGLSQNASARYAFDVLKLHRISVRVLEYNARAIRTYKKCGFVVEGRERQSALVDGTWYDDVIMGILDGEFASAMRQNERALGLA